MTHAVRFVAVAVLVALAACAPEVDELRTRAEQGDVVAQLLLGDMYENGEGVAQGTVKLRHQTDSDTQHVGPRRVSTTISCGPITPIFVNLTIPS